MGTRRYFWSDELLKIILGEIIETLVDLEQPLFEDLSEDGSLVLFDDEDFSEDKTDA